MSMYTYITLGRRTQITLTDRQHLFLRDESERTGLAMAELIRRAVDTTYRPFSRPRLGGFELSVGVWRDPDAAVSGRRARRSHRPTA
jgi:hypothetical protein